MVNTVVSIRISIYLLQQIVHCVNKKHKAMKHNNTKD